MSDSKGSHNLRVETGEGISAPLLPGEHSVSGGQELGLRESRRSVSTRGRAFCRSYWKYFNVVFSGISAVSKTGTWIYKSYLDKNNNPPEKGLAIIFGLTLLAAQSTSNYEMRKNAWEEDEKPTLPVLGSGMVSPSATAAALTATPPFAESAEKPVAEAKPRMIINEIAFKDNIALGVYEITLISSCLVKGVLNAWTVLSFFKVHEYRHTNFLAWAVWWAAFFLPLNVISFDLTGAPIFQENYFGQSEFSWWKKLLFYTVYYPVWIVAWTVDRIHWKYGPGVSQAVGQLGALTAGGVKKAKIEIKLNESPDDAKRRNPNKGTVFMRQFFDKIEKDYNPAVNIPWGNFFGTILYVFNTMDMIDSIYQPAEGATSNSIFAALLFFNMVFIWLGTNEGWMHKYEEGLTALKDKTEIDNAKRIAKACNIFRLFQYDFTHTSLFTIKLSSTSKFVCKVSLLSAIIKSIQSGFLSAQVICSLFGVMEKNSELANNTTFYMLGAVLAGFSLYFDGAVNDTNRPAKSIDWNQYLPSQIVSYIYCCCAQPAEPTLQDLKKMPIDVAKRKAEFYYIDESTLFGGTINESKLSGGTQARRLSNVPEEDGAPVTSPVPQMQMV